MNKEKKYDREKDVLENKSIAAFSYGWIMFLHPFINKRKSTFCQFHARQGLILFLLSFATVVPFFGQILFIVLLFVSVIAFVRASNGEWWKIPFVYEMSKKIKF